MSTSIFRPYRVQGNSSVSLKISIGHGQLGVTNVYLGNVPLVNGRQGNLNLDLGSGKELADKLLHCSTMVQDVQGAHNNTSVEYNLSGGVSEYEEKLQKTVQQNGEVAWYTATFDLFL